MAQDEGTMDLRVPPGTRAAVLAAAIGMHVGLAVVCGSAIYTGWQTVEVTYARWAVMLMVGAVILAVGVVGHRRRELLGRAWVRLTLALAGLLVFSLCRDPELVDILEDYPSLQERLPESFIYTSPNIALIGAIIAVIAWLAYVSSAGEAATGVVPLRRSAIIGTGLLVVSATVLYILLHGPHELPVDEVLRPALIALQGGGLVVILLGIGGGPGVRCAPHLYIGATLILAFARNVAFPME